MTKPYNVVKEFAAIEAISGLKRRFYPGDIVVCNFRQNGDNLVIEVGSSLFLVERSIFETCCKFRNVGSIAF